MVLAIVLLVLLGAPALGAQPTTPALAAPTGVRPVPGPVIRGFDPPAQRWLAGHRGVDLAATAGEPVRAVADGVVSFAGMVAGRGVVSVRLDGGPDRVVTHEPLSPAVSLGHRVRTGDVIGWIGEGGDCSGRCLHWGLKVQGLYQDPLSLLTGSVRLLPAEARPAALPPATPLAPWLASTATSSGPGVRPVPGPVTSAYGMRLHPVLGVWKLHDGVDLGAPCGTPVGSVWAGTAVSVERTVAWGLRVVVDHGSVNGEAIRTSYNHLSTVSVSPGDEVAAGGPIGEVGSTGYSTGCHLHLGLVANGHLMDPLTRVGWR